MFPKVSLEPPIKCAACAILSGGRAVDKVDKATPINGLSASRRQRQSTFIHLFYPPVPKFRHYLSAREMKRF